MAFEKKYDFDFEECLALEKAGWTIRQMAEHYGTSRSHLSNKFKIWKDVNLGKDITDIGKVHALHNAGWSLEKIADEMMSTVDKVKIALSEEPPKVNYQDEDDDEDYYGRMPF